MIRGQKKSLTNNSVKILKSEDVPKLNVKIGVNIHNRFDFEVIRDGEIIQKAYAENIILDNLTELLLKGGKPDYFYYIHVGNGSGALSSNRTSLFGFLGAYTVTNPTFDLEHQGEGWISVQKQVQLSPSTLVGYTISEVGIGNGATQNTLLTHALLKDMNGTTISIEKTSTDVINIYATLYLHWNPNGYDGGKIRIAPISTTNDYVFRKGIFAKLLGSTTDTYAERIYVITSPGACTFYSCEFTTTDFTNYNVDVMQLPNRIYNVNERPYDLSTKEATIYQNARLQVAHTGEIGAISVGVGNNTTVSATPAFIHIQTGGAWWPTTRIENESIGTGNGTTIDFKTKMPFISNATVKVNGEVVSQVTIDIGTPLKYNNMGQYFILLDIKNIPNLQNNPWEKVNTLVVYPFQMNNHSANVISTAEYIYENPHFSLGINSFFKPSSSQGACYVSNNLSSWIRVDTQGVGGTVNISSELKTSKYWKFTNFTSGDFFRSFTCDSVSSGYNIHFNTAPPEGAVITASYNTPKIPKDENHVFDFSLKLKLGEKTI